MAKLSILIYFSVFKLLMLFVKHSERCETALQNRNVYRISTPQSFDRVVQSKSPHRPAGSVQRLISLSRRTN